MKRMFPRARALGCALLALTACCGLAAGPAAAQGQNTPQAYATAPADHKLVTPNGVDLRSGRFDYRQTDLSIGAEGDSGLQLTRLPRGGIWGHVEPFANFTHNLDIMIAEKRVAISSGRYDHGFGEDYRMIVRFGSRSETFDGYSTGPHYEQISKSGTARLTYSGSAASASAIYTYEATDGTVATFRPIGGGDCSSNLRCAYVSQLVFVDGTLLSFDYEPAPGGANAARLRSVTSSRGYALLLEYGGGGGNSNMVSKACTINLAERARSAGNLCPAGVPASAYTYTMFNELVLASSTDAANATSAYQYGLAEGWGTIGFVKPGETSPWLTNFYGLHPDQDGVRDITVKQALANGQVYNVGLETSHAETEGQIDQFGSGDIVDAEGHTIKVRYGFPKFPRTLAPGYNPEIPNNFPEGGTRDPGSPPLYQMTSGPISVTDELDRTTTYDYCDPVIAAWLPAHETDRCVAGLLRSYTGPDLTRTEVTFDACRNVSGIRRHARPGSELPDLVVTATYDCLNPKARTRPLSVTDANGNITRYTYSTQHGGVLTETGPAVNGVTPQKRYSYVQRVARTADGSAAGPPVWLLDRMSYCRTGNPAAGGAGCELAGDEVVTTYDYGPAAGPGNLLLRGQAVSADGRTLRTCAAYDSQGRRTSETGANANLAACPAGAPTAASPYTSTTRFDAAGRVTGTIAPDPDGTGPLPAPAVRNGYDAAGRLTRVEQGALAAWQPESVEPKDWTGFTVHKAIDAEYDALDRKTREAASGAPAPGAAPVTGNVTEYSYDLDGRLKCTAVRMNPDEWATPLPDKCVPGPAHPVHGADRISKNVYDPAGQLTEAWDGVGTPLQRREALYTYDANGQRTSLTDARGFRAEMVHDGHGRQSRWIFPSKTAPGVANAPTETNAGDYEEYAHDLNGNRTSLRKRDGRVIGYEYDALNRVTVKDVPEFGLDVLYAYDLRNLQTGAWFTGTGRGVWTGYDGFGRPTSSTTTMGGVTRTIGAQYSRGGQRTEMTWPDGEKMSFAQDGLDRMKAVYQGALGSTFVLATFAYDPAARLQSLTRRPGDATAYGYDSVSRLKSIADTFTGGAGNVTSTFAYNPANQLRREERDNDAYAFTRQAGSRSYEANGLNQYTSVAGAAYTYDANGNLTSDGTTTFAYDSENRLLSASGARNATLVYDPLGRLFQTSGGAAGITQFLYDGDELVAEYNGSGTLLRRYVHGAGVDDPIVWYEGLDLAQPRFLHTNRQGSITGIAGATGNLIAVNKYDEYGVPAPGNLGRFQYTGQAWIPELGMFYYKARFYSPKDGRFLQVDPIGYEDQINLYAYVGNDPVNHEDPTGLVCTGTRIGCEGGIAPGLSGSSSGEFAYYQRGARTGPSPSRPVGIGRGTNARMAPGGLRGQQAPGGHGQSRHVGRTPRQLQERLQRERRLNAASTFRSEAAANRALSGAIRQNQERINDWVRRGDPIPLEVSFTSRVPLGTVLYRGQSTPEAAYTATFVLRPAPSNAWISYKYDYYVRTGYVH